MTQRAFTWLSVAVVFLGLVYYFSREDGTPRGGPGRVELLGDVDGEVVSKIAIAQGDKTVELVEQDERWRVPARANYAASGDKIRALLVKLLNLSVTQKITEDPARFAALGVDDKAVEAGRAKITLSKSDGSEIASVILGGTRSPKRPDPMSPGAGQYVRRTNTNAVYLIPEMLSFATIPEEWLEPELFTVTQNRVRAVTQLQGGEGNWKEVFRVTSTPEGTQPRVLKLEGSTKPGEKVEDATVAQLGSGLENIRISDVVPAAEASAKLKGVKFDNRTIYETNEGLLYTVDSGLDGEKLFARVKVEFSPAVADKVQEEVKEYNAALEKERASATPAPEPAKSGGDEDEVEIPDVTEKEPLKIQVSSATDAEKQNARFANWTYQLPQYFSQKLRQTRESVVKPASGGK